MDRRQQYSFEVFRKDDQAIKKLKDKAFEVKVSIAFGYCEATDMLRKYVFEF